jgi:Curli production assembly/transport component CsgG
MMGFPVPQHVRRLAVWYPRTWEQDVAYGYSRLEQAAFQLKKQRSWIKIVERRNIEPLTDEQRLQVSGRVADDSAVRVGKLLGADSMVLFRIEVPSWRDRMLARFYGRMPPVVVSSKIISVESGEVVYHDLVTAIPAPPSGKWEDYASDYELQPALRSALDHALSVAIAHLNQSFH